MPTRAHRVTPQYRPSVGKTGTLGQKPIQPGGKRQAPTV